VQMIEQIDKVGLISESNYISFFLD